MPESTIDSALPENEYAGEGAGRDIRKAMRLAQRANDVIDIQKLMSLRAFYQSAGRHDLAFSLFSRADDICWGENGKFWVGRKSVEKDYVSDFEAAQSKELERLSQFYPTIMQAREKIAGGPFGIHTITTPVIEVAGDGQTAKGLFYTPGALGFVDDMGHLVGYWMWERYGMDFRKEDDKWTFWHIHIYTDFAIGMGNNFIPTDGHVDPKVLRPVGLPVDLIQTDYSGWSPSAARKLYPRPPEPYCTFSDTFSYGPE